MTLTTTLIASLCFLSAIMATAWSVALATGRSGWIDAIWSFAVGIGGVVGSLAYASQGSISARQWLVAALAAAWSLRLGSHIVSRTIGGGDDPRYAQLRKDWGTRFKSRLFWFLQIQAAAAFLLVLTIMLAAHRPDPAFDLFDLLGGIIFVVAIIGEGVADRQLAAFRADPANKGKVCDIGLWGVSRHPNYFFEWLVWLGFAVIAFPASGAYSIGLLALIGPAFMYWLLAYVSGVPLLEAHMLRSRGDEFRAYQSRVNAFWPGPPKA